MRENTIWETNSTRNQRGEVKGIRLQATKINQRTEDCGFGGQPEYESEYDDNEPLN